MVEYPFDCAKIKKFSWTGDHSSTESLKLKYDRSVNVNQAKIFCMLLAAGCLLAFSGTADAHGVFKKQLEAKYPNKKISCNACHVDKKPKTERNAYGKLFSKTFENKTLTKDWKSKKGADKKTFEKDVMAVEFNKAYEKVKAMTFHDLVEAGVIDGITEKEEK